MFGYLLAQRPQFFFFFLFFLLTSVCWILYEMFDCESEPVSLWRARLCSLWLTSHVSAPEIYITHDDDDGGDDDGFVLSIGSLDGFSCSNMYGTVGEKKKKQNDCQEELCLRCDPHGNQMRWFTWQSSDYWHIFGTRGSFLFLLFGFGRGCYCFRFLMNGVMQIVRMMLQSIFFGDGGNFPPVLLILAATFGPLNSFVSDFIEDHSWHYVSICQINLS